MKHKGGNTPFLGILMLDTKFPRVLGDAGNVNSYNIPTRIHVVTGVGSLDVVRNGTPSDELVEKICDAAKQLETEGAFAIISTCGFLITIQDRVSEVVDIPVMMSALSLYPKIMSEFKGLPIGIITASRENLGDVVLRAAKIEPANIHITGMEDCPSFSRAILQPKHRQATKINTIEIESFVVEQALSLLEDNADISAFLLECANLPPYAQAIRIAGGRPVFSILDGAEYLTQLQP